MKLRSRRRRPEESIDDLLPRFDATGRRVLEPREAVVVSEEVMDAERERDLVRRCIDRLPEPHRTVLVLRDIEGLGTEETARTLGVSADAAKMRLYRARQALRTLLVREGAFTRPSRGVEQGRARSGAASPDAWQRPAASGRKAAVRTRLSGTGVRL
jgi:RNA polymerase sigma-70 factor (ECF subfamily)